MERRLRFLIALMLMWASGSAADTVEFPLPGVVGDYPSFGSWPEGVYSANEAVLYSHPSARVQSVAIVVNATAERGSLECCISCTYPDTVDWSMSLSGSVKRLGDGGSAWENNWRGWSPTVEGAFQNTINHNRHGGFAELNPGDELWVTLTLAPNGYVTMCSQITDAPTGAVFDAKLVLEVDYIVANRQSTWGRIKALYEADG